MRQIKKQTSKQTNKQANKQTNIPRIIWNIFFSFPQGNVICILISYVTFEWTLVSCMRVYIRAIIPPKPMQLLCDLVVEGRPFTRDVH